MDNNTLVRNVLGRYVLFDPFFSSCGYVYFFFFNAEFPWDLGLCPTVSTRNIDTGVRSCSGNVTTVFNFTTAPQCLLSAATFFVNYLKFLRSSKTPLHLRAQETDRSLL